ncbi:2-amino-4-hydroxy-6-hydroxymethyldihydropteridine diphosphokinase [Oerskovia sp. KBS0722]|nr:2-amino-4-hydroxy-6-hydroxymethyldihydropteridine diphosphokinase [Oerskovia sp. KBS0722]
MEPAAVPALEAPAPAAPDAPAALAPVPVPAAPDALAGREVPAADGPDASGGHALPDDVAPVTHQVAAEPAPAEHAPDDQVQPIVVPVPAEPLPAQEPEAPPAGRFAAEASNVETGPVPPLPAPLAVPAPLPVRAVPEAVEAPAEPEPAAAAEQAPAAAPAAPEPDPVPAPVLDRLDEAPPGFVPVVLALGANLGDAQQTLRDAVTDLDRISGLEITDVSPLARTAAVGGPEQPDYLNAILLARTTLAPRALLHAIQGVENAHGRVRAERNGPRTLDVDLIVFGTVTEFTEDLELPHPRAHERAFVLEPWAQIAPDAVLPGLGGGPVAALAATAPDRGGIRWLALDWLTDAEPEAAPVAVRSDEAPVAPAAPAPTPQAGPVPEAQAAEVVPEQTTASTPPPAPGGATPPAPPQDAGAPAGHTPAQAPANPFVPEQPAAAPVQASTPQAPPAQTHPERAVEEPGPFVPAFHPVHPQDGQEPPHAQVPPLWADVSQSAPVVEQRAQAAPAQAVPAAPAPAAPAPVATEEPVTPQFHPVHQAPASPFEPQQAPVAPEQQGSQQAPPQVPPAQQGPITGVPMSFPAELRGPSS